MPIVLCGGSVSGDENSNAVLLYAELSASNDLRYGIMSLALVRSRPGVLPFIIFMAAVLFDGGVLNTENILSATMALLA